MVKEKIPQTKESNIGLFDSIIPIFLLVTLLYINVNIYGDSSLEGSNQFVLLIGSAIAFIVGFKNKIPVEIIFETIGNNEFLKKGNSINDILWF